MIFYFDFKNDRAVIAIVPAVDGSFTADLIFCAPPEPTKSGRKRFTGGGRKKVGEISSA
jgi:hypothetical protein